MDQVMQHSPHPKRTVGEAMLGMISLSFMILFFMTVSCEPSRNGETVNYGPEASNAELSKALVGPMQDLNLDSLSVGQFVHFSTTDILAGGQVNQVESDTGQTIVARDELTDVTQLSVIQNKYVYGNSAPAKASTEFQLNIARTNATPSPSPSPSPLPSTSLTPSPTPAVGVATPSPSPSAASPAAALIAQRLEWLRNSPNAGEALRKNLQSFAVSKLNEIRARAALQPMAATTPATIHRLRTWKAMEAAPDLVKAQAGCLGIPNCQIRVRHIQFDQVTWDKPEGSRVEFDLAMSPDVPLISGYKMTPIFEYYPGLIKSCVTLMIAVGSKGSETLLTQCSLTENFAFSLPQP